MSIQGCIYSERAAKEILKLVENLLTEYKSEPKAIEALNKVKTEAIEIKSASESGWY